MPFNGIIVIIMETASMCRLPVGLGRHSERLFADILRLIAMKMLY
jgi:hypothetical protein